MCSQWPWTMASRQPQHISLNLPPLPIYSLFPGRSEVTELHCSCYRHLHAVRQFFFLVRSLIYKVKIIHGFVDGRIEHSGKSTKTTHFSLFVLFFVFRAAGWMSVLFSLFYTLKKGNTLWLWFWKIFLNLLLLEAVNLTLNLLACFQLLLHSDQELDTINNHLDQLNLREAKTISVGNVEDLIYINSITMK